MNPRRLITFSITFSTILTTILTTIGLGLGFIANPVMGQTCGSSYLFACGKARPTDPSGMFWIMEESVEAIADSYSSLRRDRFDIVAETDDDRVTGKWLRKNLAWYAQNLDNDDTFVFYIHTHGTTRGMPLFKMTFDELRNRLLAIPAKNVIAFIMTCHSGSLVEKFDEVSRRWEGRREEGRNLLVFSAVAPDEQGSVSVHDECGNPFSYAVERAVKPVSQRRRPHRFDGADGFSPYRKDWDRWRRRSGAVSMGELDRYIIEITKWADDHVAYNAGQSRKNPMSTGSYRPGEVFVTPGR